MDDSADDASQELEPDDSHIQEGTKFSSTIINEGIIAGQRIAKISVVTLISIGVAELIVGQMSGSAVATADGSGLRV